MGTQQLDEDAGVCEDAEYAAAGDSDPTLTRTRLGADAELAEADFSDVVAASRVARARTLACGVVCEDVRGAAAGDCDGRPTRTRLWEGVGPADADIGVDVGVLTRIRLGGWSSGLALLFLPEPSLASRRQTPGMLPAASLRRAAG